LEPTNEILDESSSADRPVVGYISVRRLFIIIGLVVAVGVVASMFIPPRRFAKAYTSRCYENLEDLQHAKKVWMQNNHKTLADTPTWGDLGDYLMAYTNKPGWTNGRPVCPAGGTYTLGRAGDLPTCSVGGPGHSLDQSDGFKSDK
jgi:hypothetical protein